MITRCQKTMIGVFALSLFPGMSGYADDDFDDESELHQVVQSFLTAEEAAVNEVIANAALTGSIDIAPLFDVWDEDLLVVGDFTHVQGTELWDDVLATIANNIGVLGGEVPFEVFHTIASVDRAKDVIYTRLALYILVPGTPTFPGVVPDEEDVIGTANCLFQLTRRSDDDEREDDDEWEDDDARYRLTFAQISSTPDSSISLLWGSEQIVTPMAYPPM